MTFFTERLTVGKLKWSKPDARNLLAHLHSGDVLRQTLPKLLRIGTAIWLTLVVLVWIAVWPAIYEEFERWGLVKAFFAQMISLATVFLIARLTMLRAGHLEVLPPDDFLTLRAVAVLCRWLGEVVLVYAVGTGLSTLLQPVGAVLISALNETSPKLASDMSSGAPKLLLASVPLSLFFVSVTMVLFIVLYSMATAIDVSLAIEFNTRAERVSKGRLS